MAKLGVIFVQYDEERYGHSFFRLMKILNSVKELEVSIIKVDNKKETQPLVQESILSVGGDNTLFEFSGWMKGWENLVEQKGKHDCYLFITDAFLVYGDDYQGLVDMDLLHFLVQQQAVAGLIDLPPAYYQNLQLLDWKIDFWIRTSFFFIPHDLFQQMQSLISVREVDPYCDPTFQGRAFRENSPLSQEYQKYFEQWLTQDWHSAFPLNPKNWERFRNKIHSILNEHALTGRCKEMQVPLYDLHFLKLFCQKAKKPLTQIPTQALVPYSPLLQKKYCAPSLWIRGTKKLKKHLFS